MATLWRNLPAELKARDQWCIAGPSKEPLHLVGDKLVNAKVNEPSTWMTFFDAAQYAHPRGLDIGYVLHEDDPFACIDFDVKDHTNAPNTPEKWTTRTQYDLYNGMIRTLDSYTEWSKSAKGFHVWVTAPPGPGRRGGGIECYTRERFIICTGNVSHALPIQSREEAYHSIAQWISGNSPKVDDHKLTDEPEEDNDWYVLQTACNAANGEKFWDLYRASTWEAMQYPSQSEADLALLSMLTFYSESNSQVRRMFRDSVLGKREKAVKNNDYINRTLRTIRAREARESSVDLTNIAQRGELVAKAKAEALVHAELARLQGARNPTEIAPLHVAGTPQPTVTLPHSAAAVAQAAPVPAEITIAGQEGIPWPPGVMGRIAQFVYQSSYIPVKEIGIVTAIGLMAGLAGKGWHIPLSGLNMYVNLIAKSAVGKESMHSGISAIVKTAVQKFPFFPNFVMFDDFASGPALTKACAMSPSFVNVSGEWGRKLKRMALADDGRDQAMASLRTVMTNLYQKSGPSSIVGGIRYSAADNNVASINGVAYSMIGESTPGTFYDSLTETMMEDGFLSRFLNIEYNGPRSKPNSNIVLVPDAALVETLVAIAISADKVCKGGQPSMQVGRDEEASAIMKAFELECGDQINSTQNEGYRQMWNRAALKAMRLAALIAVADNYLYPSIKPTYINWAIDVVRRDIAIMQRRIESGDVGVNDTARERKLRTILRHYMVAPLPTTSAKWQKFKDKGLIPRSYLQTYAAQSSAFSKFRGGSTQALNLTVSSLIDSGYLADVEKSKTAKEFGFSGKVYQILNYDQHEESNDQS